MKSYKKSLVTCLDDVKTSCLWNESTEVSNLQYDSRKVRKNSCFFALPGLHTQGADFIDEAIEKGATAVVYEDVLNIDKRPGVFYVEVKNIREAMARIARNFYEKPDSDLRIIGVTGTEGKSSTTAFVASLLNLLGCKTGFVSTVSYSYGAAIYDNPEHQTTPEATQVFKSLAAMRDAGCKCAVIEASSHGLSERTARLFGISFDAGICLNIKQEHLEFHKTIECYRSDKANLFRMTKKDIQNSFAVINEDDEHVAYLKDVIKTRALSFTHDRQKWKNRDCEVASAMFLIDDVKEEKYLSFSLSYMEEGTEHCVQVKTQLHGAYNAENITAAMIASSQLLNLPVEKVLPLVKKIKAIKGRMKSIDEGQDFEVIVDYAHTPSSFLALFPPIRERVKGRRMIAVFGSGGERDVVKRAEQGRIASQYCDIIILADEDPRGEDPVELLEMIAKGVEGKVRGEGLFVIPRREDAIKKAFSLAQKGDVVLLLGKGHENSIIFKDYVQPYDEESVARALLKEVSL